MESKSKVNLKLMFLNIRSVFNKIELLEALLFEETPQILCLAETWLDYNKNKHIKVDNYVKVTEYFRENKIGGGVAIFQRMKDGIKVSPVNKIQLMSVEGVMESCCAIVTCKKTDFLLLNIYRPPDKVRNNYLKFIELFDETLSFVKNSYDLPVVLCGDLNVDNFTENWEKEYLYDVLDSYNLQVTDKVYTRITDTSSTQLDYFITDLESTCYKSSILPPLLSDHCILNLEIFIDLKSKTKHRIEKRNMSKTNLALFENLMSKQVWPTDVADKNVDVLFNEFYDTFLYVFEICFPKTIFSVKDESQVKWITNEVIKSQEDLKELYWQTRNLSNQPNTVKLDYSTAKKQHTTLVENTKKLFYKSKIENSNNITKESWKIVKCLTSDENDVNISNISIKSNDELVSNPSDVANNFNKYFVEEILKLTVDNEDDLDEADSCGSAGEFFLWPATVQEVHCVIDKVSSKASAGIDDVPCSLLKHCKEVIAKPLTVIINKSFKTGFFPSRIKTSKVVPIPKNNEKDQVKNYRPVAVQSVFSKIFEMIFLKRLNLFIKNRQILSNHEYGFRKHYSTIDAIFELLITLYDSVDTLSESLCIFYDMTKAFDLISHKKLFRKLNALGIGGKSLKWISSYLIDRYQVVNIRYTGSDGLTRHYRSNISPALNTGVPQGSNLGPVLFLLYVNDLPSSIAEGKVWMFADDVSHLIHGDSESLRDRGQRGLMEMQEWCKENKLLLNKGKTNALTFYNQKKPDCSPLLRLDGTSIAVKESVKYLGISINSNLRWQQHIEIVCSRLTAVCYMVRRLVCVMEREVLMKVYHGCFHSIMKYGIVIWGGSPHAERVFLLQKRIVRTICKAPYLAHCSPLFLQLNILTLPALFVLESAVMVKRKPDIFIRNEEIHQYQTRQKDHIHVPQVSSSLAQNGPKYSCAKIYNNVPGNIRAIEDEDKFKMTLRDYLLKRPLYTIEEYFSK